MISCIVIDDEPLALKMMETYVNRTPFMELKGAFHNAIQALDFLKEQSVDLVLSDIQMPDLNGIQMAALIQQLGGEKPYLIFTTAYDQFAIEGYKVNAVGYLLKPIDYEDFLRAVLKVKEEKARHQTVVVKEHAEYLFLRLDYKYLRIPFSDIVLVESVKDYVKVQVVGKQKPVMFLSSLKAIEAKLPESQFLRIHRSYIIGKQHIDYLTKSSVHINDLEIMVGDIYKDMFKKLLDEWSMGEE
ncbi:MAG: LytTR family DNA-binding domain-containing protein [Chitinophagaceae bacterium]